MLNLILLSIDFALFLLSFVYLIIDLKSYTDESSADLKVTTIPKRSRYALMFGLFALILAVINSLWYV